jgi:hypothetical protein
MAGSGCEALDFDVVAKLAAQRETSAHEQADDRRAVRDFPDDDVVAEAEFAQPDAVGAVRADVAHAQLLAAFRG